MRVYVKEVIIVLTVIATISLLGIFGVNKYNDSYYSFVNDGHVIIYTASSAYNKYNFNENDKYKSNNKKVVFKDNENNEREIELDNFIHYEDGSLAVFKKAVILDLDDLNRNVYRYYNIFEDQILTKNSNYYEIDYINGKLNFKNFMIKVAENKYLFIGNKIEFTLNKEVKKFNDTFLEITFLDGDIVRVCNDDYYSQNISSNMILSIGDVKIDLDNQIVRYKNEEKLNLQEVTIDKDDNIVISQKNASSGGNSSGNNTGNNGSSNNQSNDAKLVTKPKANFPKVSSGIINFEEEDTEEIVLENAKIKDAEFHLVEFEAEVNSIRGKVTITDNEGTLLGDTNVKVIETSTNKTVYEKKEDEGLTSFDIEVDGLEDNNNYILVVNSNYVKNGVTYNKDFIQKTFITKSLGLSLEKDYATSNSLSINLIKDNYSSVSSVEVILLSKSGTALQTETINMSGDNNKNIVYTDLSPDTIYTVKLSNYVYSTYSVSGLSDITREFKTLKTAPSIGQATFQIDKTTGTFTIYNGKVEDYNNGVKGYRYEIYDSRIYGNDAEPLTSIERESASSVSVSIDDVNFKRGVPYIFKVITIFDDNEKIVEYESMTSEPMMIDGVSFPTVSFDKDLEATYESITGTLMISDLGNTIVDLNSKNITVVYTSSVGERKTLTSMGSLNIPIKVNNLRANETYTFSVFATIDLKDGNGVIDNCFIGSAIVKTTVANKMQVSFTDNELSKRNTFDVNVRLSDYNVDTNLEASTLTGLRFNLYSGQGTSGELIASVLEVDRNLDPYQSTLKQSIYDDSFEITPSFFNKNNNDLYSNYYTIEITGAYDYTDYKNELPLVNNIYIVDSNPYVPEYPKDLTNSIEVVPIRNGDYGGNKRSELLDATIVGYKVRAFYDNSRKYAKQIHYFMHDSETNEIIASADYNVPLDSEPSYVSFDLKDGINYVSHDNEARRGGSYYFSYTVDLDTDLDGFVDMTYPEENEVMLTSYVVYPLKQEPTFLAYPSRTETDKYVLKYYYNDIDQMSISDKLIVRINGETQEIIPVENFENDEFQELVLNIDSAGMLEVNMEMATSNIYVTNAKISESVLYRQYFSGIISDNNSYYRIDNESNRLRITFVDFDTNRSFYNRVVKYIVKFTNLSNGQKIIIDDLTINDGIIYIDYYNFQEFMGSSVKVEVSYYLDVGLYGFDVEGDKYALQSLKTSNTKEENYYFNDASGRIAFSTIAYTSFFNYSMDYVNRMMYLHDLLKNTTREMELKLDRNGFSYNYDYISPKKLVEIDAISFDNNQTFTFNNILAGISLTNENGLLNITPTINGLNFKAKIYGTVDGSLKDNLIYATIYKVGDLGETTEVMTKSFNISELSGILSITGLSDNQAYIMKLFGYIKDSQDGSYKKGYLYDIDTGEVGRDYAFKTIGNIGVDNINVVYYNPTYDYNDRNLIISYHLSQLSGYQFIKYTIEKQVIDAQGNASYQKIDNFEINSSRSLRSNMNLSVPIPVDSGIETGVTYRLSIIPVKELVADGITEEYELEAIHYNFTIDDFYRPYIHVRNSYNTLGTEAFIDFIITIKDYNGVIVNNEYEIAILDKDNQDITPLDYQGVAFSTKNNNTSFSIAGVNIGQEYTCVVKYYINQTNNSEDDLYVENHVKVTIHNSYGISTGNIYTKQSTTDSAKVILQFFDTLKFDKIKKIRYSIYNANGENVANEIYNFISIQKIVNGSTYYEYEMPTRFSAYGTYYVQLQFLNDESEVVSEETIIYNYFE